MKNHTLRRSLVSKNFPSSGNSGVPSLLKAPLLIPQCGGVRGPCETKCSNCRKGTFILALLKSLPK